MGECWPVYRLVVEKLATLQELESHYSIDDVANVNEALDVSQEAKKPVD